MFKSMKQHDFEEHVLDPLLALPLDSTSSEPVTAGFRRWLSSIHFSRWQSFAGICLYVSVAGTTYAFGVYSDLLKSNLGFTQGGLDIVASVGNTGLYMSILGGVLLDRFGLHSVVIIGGTCIFVGFMYIWLAVEGYVPADIFSVSLFFFLSQFGVCCHISSAVTSAVRLFPPEVRGSAVGLAKGYFGLSSAVLSDFSGGYFSHSKAYFILFIAVTIPIIGITGSSLANFIPQHAVSFKFDERRGIETTLLPFFFHWMCLFTILLAVGYTQYAYEYTGWSSLIMPTLLAITVLSILLLPGYYGERIISEENWRTPIKYFIDDDPKCPQSDPKKKISPVNSLPDVYFGSCLEDKAGDNSCSESTDDDERNVTLSSGLSADARKIVIRNLSASSDFSDFDVRVKIQDRKGIGAFNSTGNYGYGSLTSDNDKRLEDVEGSGGYNQSRQSSLVSSISKEGISGPKSPREVLECYYGASIPLSQSIRTWRFWFLYIAFLTICGTGLMVIDNINAIAEAVGKHPSDFFVALVSLANGAGRVSAGFASDRLSAYLSKLQLLSLVAAVMAIAQGMFAVGSNTLLYPSLLLVGYLFGCSVSLLAVNVADIFGPKYVSTNFGAVDSAPIFGSYIFVTGVVAMFYRTNTVSEEGNASCLGAGCFRIPFLINSCCCFIVAAVLLSMHISTPMAKKIASDRDH